MKSFAIGQMVTPIGEIEWSAPRADGKYKVIEGPLAGSIYVVAGHDLRWNEPSIFFSEFPYDENTPGFAAKNFREVPESELRTIDEMMKKLMKGNDA